MNRFYFNKLIREVKRGGVVKNKKAECSAFFIVEDCAFFIVDLQPMVL